MSTDPTTLCDRAAEMWARTETFTHGLTLDCRRVTLSVRAGDGEFSVMVGPKTDVQTMQVVEPSRLAYCGQDAAEACRVFDELIPDESDWPDQR